MMLCKYAASLYYLLVGAAGLSKGEKVGRGFAEITAGRKPAVGADGSAGNKPVTNSSPGDVYYLPSQKKMVDIISQNRLKKERTILYYCKGAKENSTCLI